MPKVKAKPAAVAPKKSTVLMQLATGSLDPAYISRTKEEFEAASKHWQERFNKFNNFVLKVKNNALNATASAKSEGLLLLAKKLGESADVMRAQYKKVNAVNIAEVRRLEKEFDKEEAAFKEHRAAFKDYRKVSEKNIETYYKLKSMHEKEAERRIELEVVVEDREEEIKELKARLDKVISDNIELKQFKENYLERKRKRKERKDKPLQNPPCPVKKRKNTFPDVPP